MVSIDNSPKLGDKAAPSKRQRRSSRDSARHLEYKFTPRYEIPGLHTTLGELSTPSPTQHPGEDVLHELVTLEETRRPDQGREEERVIRGPGVSPEEIVEGRTEVSGFATQLYTISYLILFAILGTLARLGLQGITFYPGAPVVFSELWANFGGSLVMGFLSEDRMLFKEEWGTPTYDLQLERARPLDRRSNFQDLVAPVDLLAAKSAHAATKKTIPLYIGLATGFCGCVTSFSSFIRDLFLALSNDLPTPSSGYFGTSAAMGINSSVHRNGGDSFMAVLAVIIVTVSVSISGLQVGTHLAVAFGTYTPTLSFSVTRKLFDPLAVLLAWGCWLGAIFLAIWAPDRQTVGPEIWRGRAVFALVFAPLGCLGRFYTSAYLNRKIAYFPLGTFAVNILGTMVLGMVWDLQHMPVGGVVGCQVLQGIEDGFCGCLTTISTWVSELNAIGRSHAYKYGAASVLLALCSLVVIMGSLRWSHGFSMIVCMH